MFTKKNRKLLRTLELCILFQFFTANYNNRVNKSIFTPYLPYLS